MANYAHDQALYSDMKYPHGAIISKGSKIIAKGYNKSRSSFLNIVQTCTHAEMDVLINYFNVLGIKPNLKKKSINIPGLSKCILWVVRLSSNGNLVDSKPCSICLDNLRKLGIKKIGYSDADGNIIICKIENIKNNHKSNAQLNYNPHY